MDDGTSRRGVLLAGSAGALGLYSWATGAAAAAPASLKLARASDGKPKNILVVLTDDHRHDALGFLKTQAIGETPTLDRLAREGAHFRNAFVTTSLCSPSRASILTGLYAHQHRVVDNYHPIASDLVFYPQYLQAAGYETALIGKWHMGADTDAPQRGFDHWVSFKGQGSYRPSIVTSLNVNGSHVPQRGYITDELTDYAVDWLSSRDKNRPWMLHLAHKAVHSEFIPAPRHAGRYANLQFRYPETMKASWPGRPMWVENQRNSWHGVDFAYHNTIDIGEYYKRYMETLLAVDEGLARIIDLLERRGELDDTLILYLGDNGFQFGEHGLIDKRTAYEDSMRIPMIARCPSLFEGGQTVDAIVANIDVAPTMLAAAGLAAPDTMAGRNILPLTRGKVKDWRTEVLYEYYWERNFPQTPTVHALREDRFKYMRFHGVWDTDELYDLQADPHEADNLLARPGHEDIAEKMGKRLFAMLDESAGMQIPISPDAGERHLGRSAQGERNAPFPPRFFK